MERTHLFFALILLTIDSAMEMAFISSIVGYLHRSGGNHYPFFSSIDGSIITVNAKPAHLWTNQGHTSNGAAGTALVAVSFGGFLVLWWMRRRDRLVCFLLSQFTLSSTWSNLLMLIFLNDRTQHPAPQPSSSPTRS